MAVNFATLSLGSDEKQVQKYERMIDEILAKQDAVDSKMRVIDGKYSISFLLDFPLKPGSFLELRARYKAAGWDDLIMNSGQSITLIKAVA